MLRQAETIGIFSSSYPLTAIAPKAAENAVHYLEQCGYSVKKGKLFGKMDCYRSGSIRERAEEFNELLYDPEVTCLMAAVGGMVSNSLLPYIDYDFLKAHPKKIIGLSDITAILLSVYQKSGLTTFYGPNLVTCFGQEPPFLEYSMRSMEQAFSGKCPFSIQMPPFYSDELTDWESTPFLKTSKLKQMDYCSVRFRNGPAYWRKFKYHKRNYGKSLYAAIPGRRYSLFGGY